MFTGLIEAVGTIAGFSRTKSGAQLEIQTPISAELSRGDSIAVDGACLTALDLSEAAFTADVSPETMARTTLGRTGTGRRVNLERPLAVGARLGGHYVLGHVDAIAKILSVKEMGNARRFDIELNPEIAPLVVAKGSVALDGISLTVNEVESKSFWVMIIPETLARTTLGAKKAGDLVNLEADVLGKYVLRSLALQGRGGVDKAFLEKHGYLQRD
jgi:riboflavin synthase